MLDQHGGRIPLYPANVRGPWRRRRNLVHGILLFIFLGLPWIQIGGTPAVLLDFGGHRFSFFGLKLWAHDAPLLFPILGLFAIGLALTTTLIGRAWCGWACPQTVFLDGVIRRIERWTEGSHLERRQLDAEPWSWRKFQKKFLKWFLFTLFSLLLTNTLLAYFFGADRVLEMMKRDPSQNIAPFFFMAVLTALILFDFAWFREQLCLIVCPYGRIQSVLMDSQTVTVHYDSSRGEPRKIKGNTSHGACVDCKRCVSVCPIGIDIRNGAQLECIACTACIDACDDVMLRTQQATGLIRHRTASGRPPQPWRPRVLFYFGVFVFIAIGLGASLFGRTPLSVMVLRAPGAPFYEQTDSEGHTQILNSYRLHAHNQSGHPIKVVVRMENPLGAEAGLTVPEQLLDLAGDQSRMIPFTVQIPKDRLGNRTLIPIQLVIQEQTYEVDFVAPGI